MKLDIWVKFPCGYELKINANSLRGINTEGFNIETCPLHDKRCKR